MKRTTSIVVGILVAASAVLAVHACVPTRVPSVPEPPDPFVRYPYIQAVTDSSARILWWTRDGVADTLVYWTEGTGDTVRVARPDSTSREEVLLAPLEPNARIGYRVVTAPPRRSTPAHRFRTAPRPGSDAPLDVLVFGDSGSGSSAQVELAGRMAERAPDVLLHTGDVAYPKGSVFDLTHRHFRVYRDLLARAPLYPVPGNHDVRTEEGAPFRRAFPVPGPRPPDGGFHYSFDWGNVHFVGLDTTGEAEESPSDLRTGDRALRWLEEDLARAAADPGIDWIVAFGHHPPYSSAYGISGHASDQEVRRLLTPLFDRYGVELVLTGHDHHYERSLPMRGEEVDRTTPGTVYLVTGGGGGRLEWRGVGHRDFAAVTRLAFHFVHLRVEDEEMVLEAVDRDGERIDRYRVPRVPPERGRTSLQPTRSSGRAPLRAAGSPGRTSLQPR